VCLGSVIWAAAAPQALLVKGNTLVPLRYIAEQLGITTSFTPSIGYIYLSSPTLKVDLTINNNLATVNGKTLAMNYAAIARNGVTYVPLRFIATTFNAQVEWKAKTNTVELRIPATEDHPQRVINLAVKQDKSTGSFAESTQYVVGTSGASNSTPPAATPTPIAATPADTLVPQPCGLPIPPSSEINKLQSDSGGYLHYAAAMAPVYGISRMEDLLKAGADVNLRNKNQQTPLHIATFAHNYYGAKWLLEHGADVNAVNKSGDTPLNDVAFSGDIKIVDLLVTHGARVEGMNQGGNTPLVSAVCNDQVGVINYLIAHGASVNTASPTGVTPLHIAAIAGKAGAAEALLKAGASVKAKNQLGNTPLDLARTGHQQAVVDLLLKYGA
jgi:ankyrin repeat protein